jgi:hypothetical protein
MYNGILVDQSIALNRKREKAKDISKPIKADEVDVGFTLGVEDLSPELDHVPRIYACATMWHETKVRASLVVRFHCNQAKQTLEKYNSHYEITLRMKCWKL